MLGPRGSDAPGVAPSRPGRAKHWCGEYPPDEPDPAETDPECVIGDVVLPTVLSFGSLDRMDWKATA